MNDLGYLLDAPVDLSDFSGLVVRGLGDTTDQIGHLLDLSQYFFEAFFGLIGNFCAGIDPVNGAFNQTGRFLSGFGAAGGQTADFFGNYRKALAMLTRPVGFNGSVQS